MAPGEGCHPSEALLCFLGVDRSSGEGNMVLYTSFYTSMCSSSEVNPLKLLRMLVVCSAKVTLDSIPDNQILDVHGQYNSDANRVNDNDNDKFYPGIHQSEPCLLLARSTMARYCEFAGHR